MDVLSGAFLSFGRARILENGWASRWWRLYIGFHMLGWKPWCDLTGFGLSGGPVNVVACAGLFSLAGFAARYHGPRRGGRSAEKNR